MSDEKKCTVVDVIPGSVTYAPDYKSERTIADTFRSPPTFAADAHDEWSDAIDAAFPTRSGSHVEYATALQMVGNRHSKGELVSLVNWLLVRLRDAERVSPQR